MKVVFWWELSWDRSCLLMKVISCDVSPVAMFFGDEQKNDGMGLIQHWIRWMTFVNQYRTFRRAQKQNIWSARRRGTEKYHGVFGEISQFISTHRVGDAAIYLLGISPTYFASFSQQFASFPHQNCFIYPKKCCIFPTVYCISPTNCFISPTVWCISPCNVVSFCQKKREHNLPNIFNFSRIWG